MVVGISLVVLCVALIVALVVVRRRQGAQKDPAPTGTPEASRATPLSAGPDLQESADLVFDEPSRSTPTSSPTPNASPPREAIPEAASKVPERRPGAKMHWLVGVTKRIKDKTFHIGDKTVTIGRLPNNFIQLDDGDVSRVHCQLRPSGDALQVMAMETKNGTRVNGETVEPHALHTLEDGDFLEVGNSVLAYHKFADFEANDADAKKSRGITVEMATAMVGGDRWAERIQNELGAHGGDIDKTARTLGIEPDVLIHMIAQLGVDEK